MCNMFRMQFLVCFMLSVILLQISSAQEIISLSSNVNGNAKKKQRIIGGDDTKLNSYPWFARFEGEIICGGSLITSEYILTAAHCVAGKEERLKQSAKIRIGALCSKENNCGQYSESKGIRDVFVHPKYDASTFKNDIALVRLDSASSIESVKIDRNGVSEFYSEEQTFEIMGFGLQQSYHTYSDLPTRLQQTRVKFVSNKECEHAYSSSTTKFIANKMLCASSPGKDACSGDSGGGLYDPTNDILSGVVSFGIGCAHPNYPGVYARIATFIPWIEAAVCRNTSIDNKPFFCTKQKVSDTRKQCDGDMYELDFQKDNSKNVLNFHVKQKDRNGYYKKTIKSGKVRKALKYKSREICVPKDQCYQVIVRTSSSQGLCCGSGTGFFRIKKKNKTVYSSRMREQRLKKVYFGNCS